jgi:hypothetical protein
MQPLPLENLLRVLSLSSVRIKVSRLPYVNRLRRAGVPREVAMRLVNHASELVHQIYQREKVEDLVQWRDAVQFPVTVS